MLKLLSHILLVTGLLLMFSTITFAYLDPSVMTYTIQVVAGVIIAVSAVIGIYWRKAKKKVQDKLGINENANKIVEEKVIEFADDKEIKSLSQNKSNCGIMVKGEKDERKKELSCMDNIR